MLRTLLVVVVLLTSANTAPHDAGKKNDGANLAQSSNEPSPSVSTEPPHWYASPEWWLFILGIPTLIVVGSQAVLMAVHARHLKELAGAAADNAKAARLSAQAVINAERALLLFAVEKEPMRGNPGCYIFHIRAVNYGKLPARRIEIGKPIHARMTQEALIASPPDYPSDLEEIFEYALPEKSCKVATFIPSQTSISEMAQIAKNAGVEVHMIENMIYGQITYMDGISSEIRHSRYCFTHEREPFSNIGGSLEPIGTEEYLECT